VNYLTLHDLCDELKLVGDVVGTCDSATLD